MKVLVTGAGGFVGQHLGRHLPCVSLDPPGGIVDVRDAEGVRAAVGRVFEQSPQPDAVIHLAAESNVRRSFENPRATLEINLFGTLHLLQALAAERFGGAFLYVGTGQVCGNVAPEQLPIREEQLPRPNSPYAVSKLAAEALCFQWSQLGAFRVVMTRPFNHIGPGQGRGFFVPDLVASLAEIAAGRREPVLQVGDLSVTRDFTDVRDVVRAYGLLLERGRNGEVYNVCSGREYLLQGVAEDLIRLSGVSARIEQRPELMRSGELRRMWASFDKLQRETGWSPQRTLQDSLRDIVDTWRKTLNG